MAPSAPKLPRAVDFSPKISLEKVLAIVDHHSGDGDAIAEEIRSEFFDSHASQRPTKAERLQQQTQLARNVLIGMTSYGLYDSDLNELTPAGKGVLAQQDEGAMHSALARHILRELNGLLVLRAAVAIQERGDQATKNRLKSELATHGITLPTNSTTATRMLQWLRQAGVLTGPPGNCVDHALVEHMTGVSISSVEQWSELTIERRAFISALRQIAEAHGTEFVSAQAVRKIAETKHGQVFDEGQLRSKVFGPLADDGWIRLSKPTKGRGGKSGSVAATPKLLAVDLDLMPEDVPGAIPNTVRAKLRTPISAVHTDLSSPSKHKKGLALEVLAVRMALDLGLAPIAFRLRAKDAGYAEVDLIADTAQLHFSRWLFQCKNTGTVQVADLAREVGLSRLYRAHVIVLVTTGRFRKTVRALADQVMSADDLHVVLVSGTDLKAYRETGPSALTRFFQAEASEAMNLKRAQLMQFGGTP